MRSPIFTILSTLAAAQGQDFTPPADPPIVAQSLPAIAEPSWSFVDGNATYFVGKQSGTVTILRNEDRPRPAPKPQPTPPPVVVKPVAWATLILPADKLTPDMAALRTDAEIRTATESAKITYRSYLDNETDIDRLNLKQFLSPQLSLVTLVLQAADGSVVKSVTIQSKADIINALRQP